VSPSGPESLFDPVHEQPHPGLIDEWVFAVWQPDGSEGLVSGHRLLGQRSWYWSALVDRTGPLLHLTEWDVVVRRFDPLIVKAPEMWAEHQCDEPMKQWTIGNEGFFVALDDPADALDRPYGTPRPLSADVEWYATVPASAIDHGFAQVGVAHGTVELLHRPNVEFTEAPARRWRRWGPTLDRLTIETEAASPDALRSPFLFPDGSIADWFLTADGWFEQDRSQ